MNYMSFNYNTNGVCSSRIEFDVQDGAIRDVQFIGGCNGNLKGIGNLVEGMTPEDAISRLEGINCGSKGTSCPDQLAKALTNWIQHNNKKSQA